MIMEQFINGHPHKVGSPFFLGFIFRCRLKLSLIAEFVIIIAANQRSQTRDQINVSKAILLGGTRLTGIIIVRMCHRNQSVLSLGLEGFVGKCFMHTQVCTVTTRLYSTVYLSNTGVVGGWWSVNMNGQLSP